MLSFLKLTGHPDSFTTHNGPVMVNVKAIESITTWHGGSRISTENGPAVYVVEPLAEIEKMMLDCDKGQHVSDRWINV